MAVTKFTTEQVGTQTQYTVPFEVIAAADIDVYIEGVLQLQQNTTSTAAADHPQVVTGEITQGTALINYTVASNNGSITFNAAPTVGDFIVIERTTDDTLLETFVPGSTIRAQDLNSALERVLFIAQEGVNIANEALVPSDDEEDSLDAKGDRITNVGDAEDDNDAVNRGQLGKVITDDLIAGEGIDLTDAAGGTNSGQQVTISAEFSTDSNPGIITVDATAPITRTYGANGQLDLSIADGAIDIAKIDPNQVITSTEQNAGASVNNTSLFTSSAAATRFDTIVQTTTPVGTDYEIGKTWLQNDDDLTLSIWNGSGWTAVTSGGTFTSLSKVVYVDAVNGNDASEGHRISNPKQTIRAAVEQINAETDAVGNGSVVVVAPGIYAETFPIDIEKNDVSIVGTSLRNCIVHPAIPAADQAGYDVDVPEANELSTMFRVNSGSYFQNLTLMGMKGAGTRGGNALDNDATFGLPTNQGWNFAFLPGATIRKSPYIQNCTNFSDSRINNVNFTPHVPGEGAAGDLTSAGFAGGGILVDGSVPDAASPLRSMVADSYTHTALNGPGILVTNNGYVQITSSYAFFNHYHLKCLNGGQANLAASTTDFGRYSLIADGRSATNIFTANCVTGVTTGGGAVTTIRVSNGNDTGTVWHGSSTRPQPNMLMSVNAGAQTYPILSSVPQDQATYDLDPAAYTGDWIVTISRPNPVNRSENLGFSADVATGTDNVQFFLRSMIASSGHTMEYVGSGTDYRALPENGGVPVEANQRVERNDGAIWTAITDHNGKFTVGDFFEVDQQLGFVTIPNGSIAFDLASDPSPELAANLDANTNRITNLGNPTAAQDAATRNYVDTEISGINTDLVNDTTPQLGGELDAQSNKIVSLADPTAAQDAATKNYVDTTTTANPIYVAAAGDTMSGELAMGTNKVTGVGDPTAAQDAATKNYVDTTSLPLAGGTLTGDVTLNAQSDVRFADSDSSNWVAFQAPATVASNVTWTLPSADATTSGHALVSDAAGTLSWAEAGTAYPERGASGTNRWAVVHSYTVDADYSIPSGSHVINAGPMTVNSGVTVTIPTGSNWTIV